MGVPALEHRVLDMRLVHRPDALSNATLVVLGLVLGAGLIVAAYWIGGPR